MRWSPTATSRNHTVRLELCRFQRYCRMTEGLGLPEKHRALLCLGAHARSGAYGTLFVCLFVCLSVCSSHIRSAGGIQECIIPSFLGLGFADLQNRTLFSSYDNICSPGRPRKAPYDSFERKFADACLSLNFWFLFVH